jgi:hypothetical protein
VAIADAYDAMIHDRPYKRAITHDQAIAELRRHAGTQFDPDLVVLFCELYGEREPKPDPGIVALAAPETGGHRALTAIIADASSPAPRRRRSSRAKGAGGGSDDHATIDQAATG